MINNKRILNILKDLFIIHSQIMLHKIKHLTFVVYSLLFQSPIIAALKFNSSDIYASQSSLFLFFYYYCNQNEQQPTRSSKFYEKKKNDIVFNVSCCCFHSF